MILIDFGLEYNIMNAMPSHSPTLPAIHQSYPFNFSYILPHSFLTLLGKNFMHYVCECVCVVRLDAYFHQNPHSVPLISHVRRHSLLHRRPSLSLHRRPSLSLHRRRTQPLQIYVDIICLPHVLFNTLSNPPPPKNGIGPL